MTADKNATGSASGPTSGLGRKLRLGLLVDSAAEVPMWAYTILSRIAASDYATIGLVVFNGVAKPASLTDTPRWQAPACPPSSQRFRKSLLEGLGPHPWLETGARFIRRGVAKVGRLAGIKKPQDSSPGNPWAALMSEPVPAPDALELTDASDLLHGIPTIDVIPTPAEPFDRFNATDVAAIKAHDLDILVRLGFRMLRGEILSAARLGVWSYHHGDPCVNRGGPAGVWEVLEGTPCTGCVLQIAGGERGDDLVVARSFSATVPLSVKANRNELYWKSVSLLPRALHELHRFGEGAFLERVREENRHLRFYSHPLYAPPTPEDIAVLSPRLKERFEQVARQKQASWEQWILLYDLDGGGPSTSLWKYKRIVPPEDRYWADPFPVFHAGRYWVFIEEYVRAAAKGHISVVPIEGDGTCGPPIRALELPYHASYPCIFAHEGVWYMVPETRQNHRVELYECVSFPDQWKLRRVLLPDVDAVDPTLFCSRGRWWMFANVVENKSITAAWDELFVFYTDDPIDGEWTPHARNPVVADVRRARPAGRLFDHNGIIYRPGQDCSRGYGYGIRLHEVLTLTEDEYREREVDAIEPLWAPDLRGVHTLNFVHGLSVADALMCRPRVLPKARRRAT